VVVLATSSSSAGCRFGLYCCRKSLIEQVLLIAIGQIIIPFHLVMLHLVVLATSSSSAGCRFGLYCCRKSLIEQVLLIAIGQIMGAVYCLW
jgi:DNA-directed RNA polymerase subunit N (RpoN/RPB10)